MRKEKIEKSYPQKKKRGGICSHGLWITTPKSKNKNRNSRAEHLFCTVGSFPFRTDYGSVNIAKESKSDTIKYLKIKC